MGKVWIVGVCYSCNGRHFMQCEIRNFGCVYYAPSRVSDYEAKAKQMHFNEVLI